MVWKGTWDQEMKGVPETHYFTWKIPSGFFLALSECPSFSGKDAWNGTGNDDFGDYEFTEKKGSKERQFMVTYKPGAGFSCK